MNCGSIGEIGGLFMGNEEREGEVWVLIEENEMIEDVVLGGRKDGLKKVDEVVWSKMGKLREGMNVGGMF